MKIAFISVILMVLTLCFYPVIEIWRMTDYYTLEYKQSPLEKIEYEINRPTELSYQKLTEEINDLLGVYSYELEFGELEQNVYGIANLRTREVKIKPNLNFEHFVFFLTHELTHLKYKALNERFVNYNAFKALFESDNEYFKNIALMFADNDLKGYFPKEYSFVGHINKVILEKSV